MYRTSWHPVFAQAIENEFEDSKDALTFETEHQLTAEPLRIDVLIIKKKKMSLSKRTLVRFFENSTLLNISDRMSTFPLRLTTKHNVTADYMPP